MKSRPHHGNGHDPAPRPEPAPTDGQDPLVEAEGLKAALADAAQRAGRLVAELLGRDRTWTSQQPADVLRPDLGIGQRQTRRYLALLKAGYRRTAQTVGHKQDPQKVERVLDSMKKKSRRAG